MRIKNIFLIFALLFGTACEAQVIHPRIAANNNSIRVQRPAYNLLTPGSIDFVIETTGLKHGVSTPNGTVAANGMITSLKSMAPGNIDRTVTPSTSGANLDYINGVPIIDLNGVVQMDVAGTTVWNYLHYNATFANMRWTVHMLCRVGFGSQPGTAYAFFGDNSLTTSKKGVAAYYDGRTGLSQTNTFGHIMTKGSSPSISASNDLNKVTPNEWHVYSMTFDGSLTAANRFKYYVDGTQVSVTVTSGSTAVVATPTHNLQIFSGGNNVFPMSGQFTHFITQTVVESDPTRTAFINSLLDWKNSLSNIASPRTHIYNTQLGNATRYYLGGGIAQNPIIPSTLVRLYRDASDHIPDATSIIAIEKSTDYGVTWGTKRTFYDPDGAGALGVGDLSAGYSSTGRLWVAVGVRTTSDPNGDPYSAKIMFSDDDGDTAPTVTDITSSLAADGLAYYAFNAPIIQTTSGRLAVTYYKTNLAHTSSANYILACDNQSSGASATWVSKTTRAPASDYINESAIVEATVSGVHRLIMYSRSDVTLEYNCFSSLDDGETWTDNGAQNMGEAFTVASPGSFAKFMLNGQSVIVFYYSDRGSSRNFKAAYAKETTLAGNPITGMDLDTKTIIYDDFLHYGSGVHPYNNMFAIGCYARDYGVLTNNDWCTLYFGTNQQALIITELGL